MNMFSGFYRNHWHSQWEIIRIWKTKNYPIFLNYKIKRHRNHAIVNHKCYARKITRNTICLLEDMERLDETKFTKRKRMIRGSHQEAHYKNNIFKKFAKIYRKAPVMAFLVKLLLNNCLVKQLRGYFHLIDFHFYVHW